MQVSMMDVDVFQSIVGVLSLADDARRGGVARRNAEPTDALGELDLLLFGDFKQLPPATVIYSSVVLQHCVATCS